jgi:hypothetical protein
LVLGGLGTIWSPNILPDNSRFGEINSPLGRREFPVRAATGIRWQGADLAHRLRGQTVAAQGKSVKFSLRREKPGILLPPAERAVVQLPDNGADLPRPWPIVPHWLCRPATVERRVDTLGARLLMPPL